MASPKESGREAPLTLTPETLERLADLCNEAGMLRHTPRSGYAFLGSGKESVAEHSYRTTVLGYMLARMAGLEPSRVVMLCLFHDLHEARTGDFNYVNHRYDTCRARAALEDATAGTGLADDILGAWDELEDARTDAARLAHDADQLDLICNLQAELSRGNEFAREWLDSALKRLRTTEGRELAEAILRTDPNRWWYGRVDKDWWVRHGLPETH
ncbi:MULTISPECIES: HD domain-containing protein [unclassified Desulfovibrio]|uniref:HD domain-containing protein n=1 Tax=unclassified Desulfovibrio TaxID=2593640 RepID=UPI001F14A766|nr:MULTISPECIES: HD domain-containing protein [unclassified Desulfovibrio]